MADDQAIFNPSSAEKMALRLLCFGASITAGWSAGGSHHYPYSSQLSARLADALPATHFSIEVDGLSGDTLINGQYNNRMQQDMKSVKVAYDWVIIQAGGNDLGWGREPETIFTALKPFWEIPLSTGANVLALTVTEHGNDNAEQFKKRETLNELISNYTDSNHTIAGGNYYVADVATAIPYKTMSESDRKLFWSDDTHFTQEGYRLMGDVIADRLIDLIQGNDTTSNSIGAMKATFKL